MTTNDRQRAAERGEIKYISPRPCRHGHVVRYTSSGDCCECQLRWVSESRRKRAAERRGIQSEKR